MAFIWNGGPMKPTCLVAVLVFLVLSMPPSLRKWRLTGQHRLTPGLGPASQNLVKVG